MGSPQTTSQNLNDWLYFKLQGRVSPGTIKSVKGFKRPTGWDKKKGKGTKGATLTLTSAPPTDGTIILQLIGPGGFYANGLPSVDFLNWDTFVSEVLSIAPEKQQAKGLSIYYPQFSSIGLTTVVIEHYTGPEYVGRGMYHAEIKICEWQQPPAVSIVKTVATTAADTPAAAEPKPVDPRITALQQAIAAANAANQP